MFYAFFLAFSRTARKAKGFGAIYYALIHRWKVWTREVLTSFCSPVGAAKGEIGCSLHAISSTFVCHLMSVISCLLFYPLSCYHFRPSGPLFYLISSTNTESLIDNFLTSNLIMDIWEYPQYLSDCVSTWTAPAQNGKERRSYQQLCLLGRSSLLFNLTDNMISMGSDDLCSFPQM